VVRAIDAALDAHAPGDICFVGHPRPVTAREILEGIRMAVGRPAQLIRVPDGLAQMAAAACDIAGWMRGRPLPLNRWRYRELSAEGFVCRVDRLRERLGVVAAIDLEAGMRETAEWYRRERWL
jgi:nucleoside-diphosphate-sugar epimerase